MAKKPPNLTLIDPHQPLPRPNPLEAPSELNETGRQLWRRLRDDFVIDDAGGLEMLFQICSASDRAHECAEAIAHDGAVIRTKAGLKDHPLLRHELATRSFVVRSLVRLGLDVIPPRSEIGRPAGDGAYRGEKR